MTIIYFSSLEESLIRWLHSIIFKAFAVQQYFHQQAYFQRVLSVKTSRHAQWLSYIAAILCTLLSIPSILLGGIAKNAGLQIHFKILLFKIRICKFAVLDWLNGTDYGKDLTTPDQIKQVLPLVLNYLTPQVINMPVTKIILKFNSHFCFLVGFLLWIGSRLCCCYVIGRFLYPFGKLNVHSQYL